MLKPEQIQHIQVIDWVNACTDLPVIHIANERRVSPQHGAVLKRMGLRPGVSDLFFPRAKHPWFGLWVELKTVTGKPTPLQLKFIEDMIKEGFYGKVTYGAEETIAFIKGFYDLPTHDMPGNRLR